MSTDLCTFPTGRSDTSYNDVYDSGMNSNDPGTNLDALAEWLERHPEIAEVTLTEIITTTYEPQDRRYSAD